MPSHVECPYHVAIVGSGPSGFFAAASLLKAADASEDIDVGVDMLEMLPTPWGLVRSGVAPDHPKIKSISKQFEKIAEDPRFRFSAMWWWASTSAQPNSPNATTP
jgi:ferredoxin/flavodoxin---NADP+ reductase